MDLLNQILENDSNCEVKSEHYSENDPLNPMSIKLDSSNIKLETEAEPLLYQNPEENMKMITHDHIEENAAIRVQETKLQIICPKSTSCSICGKLFDTNKKMRQHMSCYHDETIVQCDECQKLCKGKKAFREHKKSHQSVTCKECGDLVKKYSYPSHKNKCLGISPTKKCPHENCEFLGYNEKDIRRHIKKHKRNGERHMCSFCDLTFVNKKSMKVHMKSHTLFRCEDCHKSFRKRETLGKHRATAHAYIPVKSSLGFFMVQDDNNGEEAIIPIDKMYYCNKCTFKSKYESSVKRHQKIHGNAKENSNHNTTCELCNFKFKKPCQLEKHKKICKMNLEGKFTLKQSLDMIYNGATISQVKKHHKSLRQSVGKRLVQKNLDRLLDKATKAERKFWNIAKVKLKDKKGKLVNTCVAYIKNLGNYCRRLVKGRGYLSPHFTFGADGGQGKFIVTLTVTDKANPDELGNKYRSTGQKRTIVVLQCDISTENYDNVSELLRLLNLDEFPFPLQFAGDLKLITSICGLSGCSGRHSCYACNGCKLDENNVPTKLKTGKFPAGKEMRTFRRLLQKKREFEAQKAKVKKEGKGKAEAFDYENVVRDPIRIRPECDDDTWLLSIFPPGPLHCFLIGKFQYFCQIG